MSTSFALQLSAGLLVLLGLVHSLLGERLIFRQLRDKGLVPTRSQPQLRERQLRITWAAWHLVTLFGWALAALLWQLAGLPDSALHDVIVKTTLASTAAGAALVLYATRARHPGWVVLSAITLVLCWA